MKQNNEKTTLRGKNGNRNAAIRKKIGERQFFFHGKMYLCTDYKLNILIYKKEKRL